MNSTMPLPVILDQIMHITGCNEELAKAFISELIEMIGKSLTVDGQIEIPGIGVFRKSATAEGATVEFRAAESLAEVVNQPFAMFDPVELDDGITEEMLDTVSETVDKPKVTEPDYQVPISTDGINDVAEDPLSYPEEKNIVDEVDEVVTQSDSTQTENKVEEDKAESVQSETIIPPVTLMVPPPIPEEILNNASHDSTPEEYVAGKADDKHAEVGYGRYIEKERVVEKSSYHTLIFILIVVLSLLTGILIGYFCSEKLNFQDVRSVSITADDVQVIHYDQDVLPIDSVLEDASEVALPDTVWNYLHDDSVDAVSPDMSVSTSEIVTDTVRPGRFLTTMAREHYGMKKFWVYIYLENNDILGNPNLIPVGTVVVIPPAEKYGIHAGDPASEALAEQKGEEILEKYSKKY